MKSLEIIPVLDVLIGKTEPVGSTHIDEEREKNLKTLIDICNWCLDGIYDCARYSHATEYSVRNIGQRGIECLYEYKSWIDEVLEELQSVHE